MAKIGENEKIRPFLPPMEVENGMNLGEMLLSVISLYHGHEKKRYGKKNALEIKERQPIFVFYEIFYT